MLNNRKKTIGVFVCKLPEYFQRTLCGALADEAVANGYNLVVFSTFGEYDNNHDYVEGESNCLYIPNYDELDGIILCLDVFDIPGMAGKLIEQVKEKAHCPVISIRQKRDEFISVLSDDKKAIMAMVDHLIDEHNAKRIYYLSGPSYMHDIRMREDGFRERMKSRGVAFREEYIFMGNLWYNIGKEAVDYFLSLDDERPDAILCANDYMAISVCEELCDRGFRVPEDIIVTGFDDVEEARDIYPMLTTVEACPENFARCAMEIIKKAERGEKLEKQYYISTQNQYRNSCGCKEAEEAKQIFRKQFKKNQHLVHLYKQNMFMVFRMEGIRDYQGLPDLVGKFVEGNTGVSDFYICLNPDEKYELDDSRKSPYEDEMEMLLHAYYGKKMSIEVPMPQRLFKRKNLLPADEVTDRPCVFYINPLHYRKHCFGYAIISFFNNRFYAAEDFYQSFVINICTVLENIYIQNQIEQLSNDKIRLIRRDSVTHMYNPYGFHEMATQMLHDATVAGINCVFFYVRLENLQEITEIYGKKESNEILLCMKSVFEKFEQEKHVLGRLGGSDFCLLLEDKMQEEIEVLAQNFVNEVNEVNISWNKEFFIEVRYGWFVKEVGTISSTDECIRSAKMKMKVGAQMQTSAAKYAFEAMKEIRQNYQKEISVTYMAEQIGISRTHLSHCFKLIYQKSIQDYITSYRMEKAQELLIHTQKKIKEIAFLVGYKDELYFSKVFARLYGMSPSKFRKTMLT